MCNEYEIFEFLELENRSELRNKRKRLRISYNPFEMDESEFIEKYRLTPDLVLSLCEDLEPIMKLRTQRASDLTIEMKVLTAIYVYAHGSYQKHTGIGQQIAQQTVSAVLAEVTAALNNIEIKKKYIKFPQTEAERDSNKLRFIEKFGIPGVIGCIGGTHVAIMRPNENENEYFCTKNYHSLNIQLICNADMEIISVDANNPGGSSNSKIWSNHHLKLLLENLCYNEQLWLLGDSDYPQHATMMTPILDVKPDSPEAYFMEKHLQTREIIVKTIGILKARFRCLSPKRMLHYQPHVAANITNACVILHNICNAANIPVPELSDQDIHKELSMQPSVIPYVDPVENAELEEGIAKRRALVFQLWQQREFANQTEKS